MNIPITKPFFGAEERDAILKPLETGWVVQGPYVKEFEDSFAQFTGIKHAVATTSCTTALHIAVSALKLQPGDEVIVPAFTWISTANVVEFMGGTPIFCDIDLQSFNIDPKKIEALITEQTVGIIPVHLFGLCADMEPILQLAKKHKLWVVEDAACAFDAWYDGRHAGGMGDMGCFSFHPRKSITTGEGGMITTQVDEQASLCRILRDHGASRTDLDRHKGKSAFLLAEYNHLGYNYRMTDMQGAMGVVQLKRAEWIMAERRRCATFYDQALADCTWLNTPFRDSKYIHGNQAYVCLFRPEEVNLQNVESLHELRNELMTELEEQGISTRQGTHAPVLLGYYRDKYSLIPEDFPNATIADKLSLTLPVYPQMTELEQEQVVAALFKTHESQ